MCDGGCRYAAMEGDGSGGWGRQRDESVRVMRVWAGRYAAMEGDDKYRLEAFDEWMEARANKEALEKEAARQAPPPSPAAPCSAQARKPWRRAIRRGRVVPGPWRARYQGCARWGCSSRGEGVAMGL